MWTIINQGMKAPTKLWQKIKIGLLLDDVESRHLIKDWGQAYKSD